MQLRDAIRDLISKGSKSILLNLGDVNYIDSSGLGELVSAYTTAKNQGADLKLLNLTKKVKDVLSTHETLYRLRHQGRRSQRHRFLQIAPRALQSIQFHQKGHPGTGMAFLGVPAGCLELHVGYGLGSLASLKVGVIGMEAQHAGPNAVGEFADKRVVVAKTLVVAAARYADAVLGTGELVLQAHELIA